MTAFLRIQSFRLDFKK